METKKEEILLPESLYKSLKLNEENLDGQKVLVTETANAGLNMQSLSSKDQVNYAPQWFLVPTFIATLIFAVLAFSLKAHVIPLSGGTLSIGTSMLTVANGICLATFIVAYVNRRNFLYTSMTRRIYWRTFPIIIAAYLLIMSLAMTALFWFVGQAFHGVAFDKVTSILIFAVFTGILAYFVIFLVDAFSVSMLLFMLILVAVGGLLSSMVTSGNQYWWQRNFSLLGTAQSSSSWQFNLTLVVAAALFFALIDYIFVSLRQKFGKNYRHNILRALLSFAALSIAGVGLVPNNGQGIAHFWHDQISMMIVYFMGAAIILIQWLLPEAGKNFIRISYGVIALLVAVYVFWHFIHYLSLTAFEIFGFALCFAWLMLFINTLLGLLWDERKIYSVKKAERSELQSGNI